MRELRRVQGRLIRADKTAEEAQKGWWRQQVEPGQKQLLTLNFERSLPVRWPQHDFEDLLRLVPSGLQDRASLQAQQMRCHGPWTSNCSVYLCSQGLQPCDHTRLLFFIFQTQMPVLQLAQITITMCGQADL